MGLVVTKKSNVMFLNRKDEYYKNYWVNKKIFNGIELVPKIVRTSKKQATGRDRENCRDTNNQIEECLTYHIRMFCSPLHFIEMINLCLHKKMYCRAVKSLENTWENKMNS